MKLLTNKFSIARILGAFFLTVAIAFSGGYSVLAATADSNTANTAKQASEEVKKETGAKKIFGKSEKGDRLIDDAQAKASKKLDNLADEANSNSELPESKKLFLDNVTPDR